MSGVAFLLRGGAKRNVITAMNTNTTTENEMKRDAAQPAQRACEREAKWAAKVEDRVIPAPRRQVKVMVLKDQAGVAPACVLVRDHGGEHDVALEDHQSIDLAQGNVFYTVPACEAPKGNGCTKPAKLAFFVDDHPEETLRPDQTDRTLRDLFGLAEGAPLFRDYESPIDQEIGPGEVVRFADGPVFYTRRKHATLTIFVNDKPFTDSDGVKGAMTGEEIAGLVADDPKQFDVFKLPTEEPIQLDQKIKIQNCDHFKVVRKIVTGGYESTRLDRELEKLRQGGAKVTFVPEVPAVVYHDIPARKGYPHLEATDVLVKVPGGYPGQPLDGAFLPQGSPLLGKVAGAPQGQTVQALDRTWQLVSYHPHAGGGAPPWNKDKHGFHTYVDELLSWVHRAKQ